MTATKSSARFSGHETFVCRYAWLPKVVTELTKDPLLFRDEVSAMVRLGIGKNMVRSAKFWAEAAQLIEDSEDNGHSITDFGRELLGHEGHDQYLEHPETLWLIHWKFATHPERPLFHWEQMLNFWHRPEFSESEVIPFLVRALTPDKAQMSERTLSDGYKVFVNSYVPSRGRKGEIAEDNLDCPLVELGLIRTAGERLNKDGHREPIYSFSIEPKPTVSVELFAYCLAEFWRNSDEFKNEESLSLRAISTASGSPGQIFKLPEAALTTFLESLSSATGGAMSFEESRSMQQVFRKMEVSAEDLLNRVYNPEQ